MLLVEELATLGHLGIDVLLIFGDLIGQERIVVQLPLLRAQER